MEFDKKVYNFNRRPGEDFHLWCVRTESALEAKVDIRTTQSDLLRGDGELSDADRKDVATARAVVIQGLGYRILRLCLPAKNNPFVI